MKLSLRYLVVFMLLGVSGCMPAVQQWMSGGASTSQAQAPKQEAWCYKSLAQIDCYPAPQRLPPESLVSVSPPNRFPASREAYAKALADSLAPKK